MSPDDARQPGRRGRRVKVEIYPMPAALGGGYGVTIDPPVATIGNGFATVEEAKDWARSWIEADLPGAQPVFKEAPA